MTDELSLLQTLKLKGRVGLDTLLNTLNADPDAVSTAVHQLVRSGLAAPAGNAFKLTPAGRQRLTELIAAERQSTDSNRFEMLYEEFTAYNISLKKTITDWQLKGAAIPNDHTDAEYDAAIVQRLVSLHLGCTSWLQRLSLVVPRLSRYGARLAAAIRAVEAGDHGVIAKPIIDSYHTIWFELHEELIALSGRDRAGEAAAGRAF